MDPAKLKVVELRAQLSQRGLDTKGNKAMLVERLRKALEEELENHLQEKANTDSEDSRDSSLKDVSEKTTDSPKSTQPPKTTSRSSRSSSVVTLTKISTRNSPKNIASPITNKQSPSKVQLVEKANELSTSISESVSEELEIAKEDQVTSPIKNQKSKESPVKVSQNEVCTSAPDKSQEALQDSKITEEDKLNLVCLSTTVESPKQVHDELHEENEEEQEEQEAREDQSLERPQELCPVSKNNIEEVHEEQQFQSVTSEEPKQNLKHVEQNIEISQNDLSVASDEKVKNALDKNDQNIEAVENIQSITQPSEKEHGIQDIQNVEDQKYMNIPKDEQLMPTTPKQDQMCDSETEEKEKFANDTTMEDKDINLSDSAEDKDKKIETTNIFTQNEQDIEMKEITHDEEIKVDWKDSEKKDRRDRKRKRSPSPVEDHQKSPISTKSENEPVIDDTAVMLSWYDSDLNLNINKDGFHTATPFFSDGFCYIWAGARASYGFVSGKVYYEAKISEHCTVNMQDEENLHVLRVGWSISQTSMQLGEEKLSYGYDSIGKISSDKKFTDYGSQFNKDDIVGCYLDATSEDSVMLAYTVNGKNLGTAFSIPKEELKDRPLFPHILSKNCTFVCNFGQEEPWSEQILDGYIPVGNVDLKDRIPGPRRPEKREECEVIMMCGLPASGKTFWATKYVTQHPEKAYNLLGIDTLINRMRDMGVPRKQIYHGRWKVLTEKCNRSLNKLIEIASTRRRNYILDQTNVYPSAQRRIMRNFHGYQRKAVVVVPTDEEYKSRSTKHETFEGKEVTESTLMEMKANFSIPIVGESFEAVDWVELDKEEAKKLIERYNKEGKEAEYGQQANKRPRFDRIESNRDNRDSRNTRDNRESRDHRDRRSNYPDRNRNPAWRGGSNMAGWRDRPRGGGHMRHVGGYGPPGGRRGRGAPIPPLHRGADRRGIGGDRRSGNDRNRSGSSRQGGWGPMSNYQGSQQSGWQGNWSSGQSQQGGGWGQGGWGQPWGNNWKGYGQGSSYGQSNYGQQQQQGYGNGNWGSSWNQQYYNQYWGQQQQSAQTTTAGGQAISTIECVTPTSSANSDSGYSYTQGWQGYTQEYTDPAQSASTNAQECQQHK